MEFRIEVLEGGELKVSLTLLYLLLRRGGLLRGPYLHVKTESASIEELINDVLTHKDVDVPSVNFCPSDEPVRLYGIDDVLGELCSEVYTYFNDRCAACVIKVFSVLSESWLVSEEFLVKLFQHAIKHGLPAEFFNGNIILTTCPANYEDASKLPPGSYLNGINVLKRFAVDFLSPPTG